MNRHIAETESPRSQAGLAQRAGNGRGKEAGKARQAAIIGLMGALAGVLMLIKFPLPFMPPFMDFDLSGLVEVIGGFLLGPTAVIFIVLVKLLVKLALMGSSTMLTGELQNFLLSCAYAMPAAWLYRHHKSKRSGEIGMAAGTILCTFLAVTTNLVFMIPFYVNLFGMTMDQLIAMCTAVNPLMKDMMTLALFGIVPFNVIKCGVSSVITVLVYKRVSRSLKSFLN